MKNPIELDLTVTSFSEKGYGVARLEGSKVEIAHVIPGDVVKIGLQRKRKGIKKGKLLEVLKDSSDRVKPKCKHAYLCGGCSWQQMSYEAQLRFKENIVKDAFQTASVRPIIPAVDTWNYRNKMEFTFSENAAKTKFLGLMIAHAAYVFNLEECHLAKPWVANVVNQVRAWWEKSGLLAYRLQTNSGSLRHLTIKEGFRTSEKMVILTIAGPLPEEFQKSFVKCIHETLDESVTIVLRVQRIQKGTPTEIEDITLHGKGYILEKLFPEDPLYFRIGPSSFFQPNPLQAEIIYREGINMLELNENSLVYDLYSGTGTLGMCASRKAGKVLGIELCPKAVKDAEENIALNSISNFTMHQGDAGKVLTRLLGMSNIFSPDCVIVDPPRAGLDPLAISHLQRIRAKKILYISCNPRTQAVNVQELERSGYELKIIQPIDQFPHTAHVENLTLLVLK